MPAATPPGVACVPPDFAIPGGMIHTTSTPFSCFDGQADSFSVGPASAPPTADGFGSDLRLVDRVSHEFRTPLTVIKEYVSLIRDGLAGQVSDEQRRMLDAVGDRADDLAILVDDMLDAGRLAAGQLRAWRRLTSMTEIIAGVETTLVRKAAASGVALSIHIEPDLPEAFCDARQVGRAIVNLVVDAIRCSDGDDGSIRMRAWHVPGTNELAVAVTDNGPGVAPENPDRDFDTDGQPGDPTLGLRQRVACGLVELNLGRLDVEREPGIGSTYSLSVPLLDPADLVRRTLQRFARAGQHAGYVALLRASAEKPLDLGRSNVVDEALQHVFAGNDLVLRVEPHRWLAVVSCPEGEADRLPARAADGWAETLRTAPAGFLPELRFGLGGSWDRAEGHAPLLRAFGAELDGDRTHLARVLVADDDRDLLDQLATQLGQLGYEVLTACDGRAAIQSATLFPPDAILMDDRMPGIDGLEALRRLHDRPDTAGIPVIMHADRPHGEHEAPGGHEAECWLSKACDLGDLQDALERLGNT